MTGGGDTPPRPDQPGWASDTPGRGGSSVRADTHGPMAPGMYGTPGPATGWQHVTNQAWPLVDDKGQRHARGIPGRDPIPIRACLTFARDGDAWLDGDAVRWQGQCVCVHIIDSRLQVPYVWLAAADVERRQPTPHGGSHP